MEKGRLEMGKMPGSLLRLELLGWKNELATAWLGRCLEDFKPQLYDPTGLIEAPKNTLRVGCLGDQIKV